MNPLRTLEFLKDFIRQPSVTATAGETALEQWLDAWLGKMPYFKEHPADHGRYPCAGDALGRSVVWGLVQGRSKRTLVMVHHHDVVGVTDYGIHQGIAYDAEKLADTYEKLTWSDEIQADLRSGQWLFGRGSCDMKGGGAAQLAFLSQVAGDEDREASLLLISVPDEENLSAGMISALPLLEELKRQHGLDYVLVLNSEPNFGRQHQGLTLFTGSTGKMTGLAYVQGFQCHTGTPFEGLNGASLLAEIVADTDGNCTLSDAEPGCFTPPLIWTGLSDLKAVYDVSVPDSAWGTFNFMFLSRGAAEAMDRFTKTVEKSFDRFLEKRQKNHQLMDQGAGQPSPLRPVDRKVISWESLKNRVLTLSEEQQKLWQAQMAGILAKLNSGGLTLAEATRDQIRRTLQCLDIREPLVVVALVPPFYPAVRIGPALETELLGVLEHACGEEGLSLEQTPYFMGISDLSYCSAPDPATAAALPETMPLWGRGYTLPLGIMHSLDIPGINLGPRGKDLHQKTERVLIADVTVSLPRIYHALGAWITQKRGEEA